MPRYEHTHLLARGCILFRFLLRIVREDATGDLNVQWLYVNNICVPLCLCLSVCLCVYLCMSLCIYVYVCMHVCMYVGARCSSVVRAFAHVVDPLSYFSFQLVFHDWCNKGRGMYYFVYVMMHIKEPLLLVGKSSPCGDSGFPISLSEWSFTICLTPYNRK